MESKKYVYLFNEGNANMKNLLGGKGANLAEMINLGIPVPQGFTLSTEACTKYYENGGNLSEEITAQIYEALIKVEKLTGKKFGSVDNPLIVSVRSGARISMPGVMDTILNLGLNDETVEALSKLSNNERFAYDSYRRFIQMFSNIVMGIEKIKFQHILDEAKRLKGIKLDNDLNSEDLKDILKKFKALYKEEMRKEFPQNLKEQLLEAIKAVFSSWNNTRAVAYRRTNNIPLEWGTAVNVQSMVFGNMGETSGTGVAFTRNPCTGENLVFGEYLINAQGEDVVAGVRTPHKISILEQELPECYKQFIDTAEILEKHYMDMQDMEFTIEQGKLYFLQTRNGKRTPQAALKIAVDLIEEGIITREEAALKVDSKKLDLLLHAKFDQVKLKNTKSIVKVLPSSLTVVSNKVSFNSGIAKRSMTAHVSSIAR
ncbi:pyruvate, phosphate dikinase [Clostridium sp. P21]|uniref:Pyruvate, phosphate dikinase n=1 Tax=Clostridium muellerianum TaxID=2716538 RepID=A0A7Y0EHG6_9CLOT|nr:pyruvate, phosphate dikinase [Clostridium muellerianum]